MSNNEEYPEVIYGIWRRSTATTEDPEFVYDLGFERGVKHAQANTGEWFNLTEAIASGAEIDWEQLDGVKARCVHAKLGSLTHKMTRHNRNFQPENIWGVELYLPT